MARDASSSAEAGRWLQYASPAEAGYSAAALDSVRRYADSVRSGAVLAVYRGHAIAAAIRGAAGPGLGSFT